MNIKRAMVLTLAVIVKWKNFCYCKEYQLKSVEDPDTRLEKLQNRAERWDLLKKIFKYDRSVTVIIENFIKKDLTWHNSFIRLLQMNLGLPVAVVEMNERLKLPPTNNDQNNYGINTNTSYILVMDDVRIYSLFLEQVKISSMNWHSRTRFAIMTYNESLTTMHEIFRLMWNTYGIGRAIAFDLVSGNIAAYNFLKDTVKLFNASNVEEIFNYSSLKKNLEGYPIRVTMVHNPPTSIAIPNSTRFEGVNQMIFDTLERYMNFTLVMCKPIFRDKFGTVANNGTTKDTMRQVVNREVDVDGNMKFITSYNMSDFEFTTPVFSERIHVVVPKAERVPLWLSTYQIFDDLVWIPTICLFAIFVIFWICISKFYYNTCLGWQVGSVTIDVLFLLTGQPVSKRMDMFLERLLVIFGSIFAVIMVSCFTGHLFQRFSEVAYYPDIDSLDDLEKSGLPLVRGSYDVKNALSGTENVVLKSLLTKLNRYNNLSTAFDLKNGILDHAVLSQLTRINYEIADNLIKNNGTELLHTIKTSLGKFSMAYIVSQGWFFLEYFNSYINNILEAGLIQKWYLDSIFEFKFRMLSAKFKSSGNLPRAFILSDLNLAWYILNIGLLTSGVTLLIEIAWHYHIMKKAQENLRKT